MKYYFEKQLEADMDSAIARVEAALQQKGFGVVSRIDLQAKLKEKLGVDFRPYVILGACNPGFAYQALQKEDKIGTMLPCNVIVQHIGDNLVEVAAVDPVASMQAIDNPELGYLAMQVKQLMKEIIELV